MARPKFEPKSTHSRGRIHKPHYLPYPWTRPTYDAKRHPDPIRHFSTMHWTDRQTDRPTDRSFRESLTTIGRCAPRATRPKNKWYQKTKTRIVEHRKFEKQPNLIKSPWCRFVCLSWCFWNLKLIVHSIALLYVSFFYFCMCQHAHTGVSVSKHFSGVLSETPYGRGNPLRTNPQHSLPDVGTSTH